MKQKLLYLYDHLEEVVLVVLFVVLVAAIFLQVVARYIFNNSPSWTEELGKYAFVWLSWIGISIGAKKGEHIKITALTERFPFRVAEIFNILSELVVIAICGVTLYYGVILCDMLLKVNVKNTVLGISQAWGTAAVPVGCGLMVFRCIQSICRSVKNIRSGPLEPDAGAAAEGGAV